MNQTNTNTIVANRKNTKVLVTSAVLIALGSIIDIFVPSMGIKPDFMSATLFIAILLNPTVRHTFTCSFVTGVLAALTTHFPGGEFPSVLDKVVCGFTFMLMLQMLKSRVDSLKIYHIGVLAIINTIISGFVFVYSCLMVGRIMGLAENIALFSNGTSFFITAVVLPTAVANGFLCGLLSKVMEQVNKRY